MKALVVKTDGTAEVVDSNWEYSEINNAVGGWIEAVSFGDKPYFAYINEEGKINNLPENNAATSLWYDSGQRVLLGDYIAGNAVFFGLVDDEGYNTDIPSILLTDIIKYHCEFINNTINS